MSFLFSPPARAIPKPLTFRLLASDMEYVKGEVAHPSNSLEEQLLCFAIVLQNLTCCSDPLAQQTVAMCCKGYPSIETKQGQDFWVGLMALVCERLRESIPEKIEALAVYNDMLGYLQQAVISLCQRNRKNKPLQKFAEKLKNILSHVSCIMLLDKGQLVYFSHECEFIDSFPAIVHDYELSKILDVLRNRLDRKSLGMLFELEQWGCFFKNLLQYFKQKNPTSHNHNALIDKALEVAKTFLKEFKTDARPAVREFVLMLQSIAFDISTCKKQDPEIICETVEQDGLTIQIINLKNIDITKYPEKKLTNIPPDMAISIGDSHGNALQLLHILILAGIVDFVGENKQQQYKEFAMAYFELQDKDLELQQMATEVDSIRRLIGSLQITRKDLMLISCGDNLAERVGPDFVILWLFDVLHRARAEYMLPLSNHDLEALVFSERQDLWSDHKRLLGGGFTSSLDLQKRFVEAGVITAAEILTLMHRVYFSHMHLALSASDDLKRQKGIIWTHAPNRPRHYKQLAKALTLVGGADDFDLLWTNALFRQSLVEENLRDIYCFRELRQFISKRRRSNEAVATLHDSVSIHGHDAEHCGEGPTWGQDEDGQRRLLSVCLDNSLGKWAGSVYGNVCMTVTPMPHRRFARGNYDSLDNQSYLTQIYPVLMLLAEPSLQGFMVHFKNSLADAQAKLLFPDGDTLLLRHLLTTRKGLHFIIDILQNPIEKMCDFLDHLISKYDIELNVFKQLYCWAMEDEGEVHESLNTFFVKELRPNFLIAYLRNLILLCFSLPKEQQEKTPVLWQIGWGLLVKHHEESLYGLVRLRQEYENLAEDCGCDAVAARSQACFAMA